MQLRDAVEDDVPGILSIYNEVITNSTAIYAEKAVTLDERLAWFKLRRQQGYPVLIASDDSGIIGFISFGDFRAWPCYLHTVEHSVHVRADRRGRSVGRALMEALIPRASALGKHVLIAGIDADNVISLKLHRSLGFEQVAHFREVGRKFNRWLDLVFMQRFLDGPGAAPKSQLTRKLTSPPPLADRERPPTVIVLSLNESLAGWRAACDRARARVW